MEQGMETEVPALNGLQQREMRRRYEEIYRRVHGKGQGTAFHKNSLEAIGTDSVI